MEWWGMDLGKKEMDTTAIPSQYSGFEEPEEWRIQSAFWVGPRSIPFRGKL